MTFTTNLLEEFEVFESSAYEAITTHNQKVRKATDSFERFVTRNDRNNMATDALEELENFLTRFSVCIEKEEDRLEALAVARSKIVERTDILRRLHIALLSDSNDKSLQEQMNSYFGNEHYWKKEFKTEILDLIYSYDDEPSLEKRDYLLSELSTLVKVAIKKVSSSSGTLINDISKMPAETLSKEKKETRKNIANLVQAIARANNLKVILQKLKTEF